MVFFLLISTLKNICKESISVSCHWVFHESGLVASKDAPDDAAFEVYSLLFSHVSLLAFS